MGIIILADICGVVLFGLYIAQAVARHKYDMDKERLALRPARPAVSYLTTVTQTGIKAECFTWNTPPDNKWQMKHVAGQNVLMYQGRVVDRTEGLLQ